MSDEMTDEQKELRAAVREELRAAMREEPLPVERMIAGYAAEAERREREQKETKR